MPSRLAFIFGPKRGVTLEVSRPLVIGRALTCDVRLSDGRVSREHCVFDPVGEQVSVRDVGSRNGTWVNSKRIEGPTTLSPNDTVAVGATLILFGSETESLRAMDGDSTVVLNRSELGLITSAEQPSDDTLGRAGRLVLEAALAPDSARAAEALARAFAIGLNCDEVVICGRTPEGKVRPRAAFPTGAAISLNSALVELALTQQRTVSVEEPQLFARHDSTTTTALRQRAFVVCAPILVGGRGVGVVAGVRTTAFDSTELALGHVLVNAAAASLRFGVEAADEPRLSPLIAESPSLKLLVEQATRAAQSATTILLTGESGTGKEAIARLVHESSKRWRGPLVSLNCGAIPSDLAENELFGHEKGAFSGASTSYPGVFERADGGTLFLDEVGELPLPLQVKLLRVLEEKWVHRLGATTPLTVDVRVVAATNRNLEAEVEKGAFRRDLYYRLNVVRLKVEPLRTRPEDVLPLASHFLTKHATALGRQHASLSAEAAKVLKAYDWPGNARELSNAIERALVLKADEGELTLADFPAEVLAPRRGPSGTAGRTLAEMVATLEHEQILLAMKRSRGVKTQAAEALGISRPTLDRKLAEYGIDWFTDS